MTRSLRDPWTLGGLEIANRRTRVDGGSFALERPAPCVVRLLELVRLGGEIRILPVGSAQPPAA